MTDEERQQRIHHHMYETCEGIAEHAERIVKLEELVQDMDTCIWYAAGWSCEECPPHDTERCDFEHRMDELGIPHK